MSIRLICYAAWMKSEDGAEDKNVVGYTASPARSAFQFFRGGLLILAGWPVMGNIGFA
jgi:hypothetical protein